MKDVVLWQLLTQGAFDSPAVEPLLLELARLPIGDRIPFFGSLAPLLERDDPALRAAALKVLAGAEGVVAFRRIVRSLDDRDPSAMKAAVGALLVSCERDKDRWVHALFHPSVEVRREALARASPIFEIGHEVFLFADPTLGETARRIAMDRTLPRHVILALLEFMRQGTLSRPETRLFLCQVATTDPFTPLEVEKVRTADAAAAILRAAVDGDDSRVRDAESSTTALDERIDLFWDPVDPSEAEARGGKPPQEEFFERILKTLGSASDAKARAIAASLVLTGARRGSWPAGAATACVASFPPFLRCAWVPREVRRAAAAAVHAAGSCRKWPNAVGRQLFEADICRHPSGALDLRVLAGMLPFFEQHPYGEANERFGLEAIVAAIFESPSDAAHFLSVPEEHDPAFPGKIAIIDAVMRRGPGPRVLASIVLIVPIGELSFLEGLGEAATLDLFRSLAAVTGSGEQRVSDRRAIEIGGIIGRRALSNPGALLAALLDGPVPEENAIGLRALRVIAEDMGAEALIAAILSLPLAALKRLLRVISSCAGFPYGKEVQIALALREHADPEIATWVGEHIVPEAAAPSAPAPALPKPRKGGICKALARRPRPKEPDLSVCIDLLSSGDPIVEIDEQFCRFGSEDPAFLARLDLALNDATVGRHCRTELSLLENAWLSSYEAYNFAFGNQVVQYHGGFAAVLRAANRFGSATLRGQLWRATTFLFAIYRYREPAKLESECSEELVMVGVDSLRLDIGERAANLLVNAFTSHRRDEIMGRARPKVEALLPDLAAEVRLALSDWVSSRGLAAAPRPRVSGAPGDMAEKLGRIEASSDLDELAAFCRDPRGEVVQEAALRLTVLGPDGLDRLLRLLEERPALPTVPCIAPAIALWPEGAHLEAVRRHVRSGVDVDPHARFVMGLALVGRGERGLLPFLFEAACAESPEPWFRASYWQDLYAAGVAREECAIRLALSPHPHAYQDAVKQLVAKDSPTEPELAAVRGFLETGTERLRDLRAEAALWLHDHGDRSGFPVLLSHLLTAKEASEDTDALMRRLLQDAAPALVRTSAQALLMAGPHHELLAVALLQASGIDPAVRQECLEAILKDAAGVRARSAALGELKRSPRRVRSIRALAELFAWGVQEARLLTGRKFAVEMHAGADLGYTYLGQSKVFVTPLPLLRGERHGQDLVKGLILHELGHHMYHAGPEDMQTWEKAREERLAPLLNLVADEHLERNLRALDPAYGDRFKRLAAFAFQHADREISVEYLLPSLGARAFQVLTRVRLGVARRAGHVRILAGNLLLELERAGSSFARFVRALRMGLGNRHDDPTVARALALFGRELRRASLGELLDRTRQLREIFAEEASIIECFNQDANLAPDPADILIHGEGIEDGEIQREVERILNPRTRPRGAGGGAGGTLWINVEDDERFNPIAMVVPLDFKPAEHRRYAGEVAREARLMREYLMRLGLALVKQRQRIRGRGLDRGRLAAALLRGDPRLLVAREIRTESDLFLGVLIDCSGSMRQGDNIERAKLFGVLLAEACKDLRGVDVRIFGFTDSVIYDAGDARRCAVHALSVSGGNNDAAALLHGATVAQASRRRARLLVMISDGLPTECSVAALRGLVRRVSTRLRICCAQVAVRPLEEICFPHYVVLEESNTALAVRAFGRIVGRLVQKTLRGS